MLVCNVSHFNLKIPSTFSIAYLSRGSEITVYLIWRGQVSGRAVGLYVMMIRRMIMMMIEIVDSCMVTHGNWNTLTCDEFPLGIRKLDFIFVSISAVRFGTQEVPHRIRGNWRVHDGQVGVTHLWFKINFFPSSCTWPVFITTNSTTTWLKFYALVRGDSHSNTLDLEHGWPTCGPRGNYLWPSVSWTVSIIQFISK
jgi:hypothetical protein